MANSITKLLITLLMVFCTRETANAANSSLVFYMHDIVTGKGQTALPVILPNGTTTNTGFGAMTVIDDALTETADPSSKVLGRGQGIYISAAQDKSNLFVVFTAVLTSPEFNQSTISFQGADRFQEARRDVSVVGGTGMFQFAQGSATIETISIVGSNAVIKYTVSMNSAASSNSSSSAESPSSSRSPSSISPSGSPSSISPSGSPSLTPPSSDGSMRAGKLGFWVLSVLSVIYVWIELGNLFE